MLITKASRGPVRPVHHHAASRAFPKPLHQAFCAAENKSQLQPEDFQEAREKQPGPRPAVSSRHPGMYQRNGLPHHSWISSPEPCPHSGPVIIIHQVPIPLLLFCGLLALFLGIKISTRCLMLGDKWPSLRIFSATSTDA